MISKCHLQNLLFGIFWPKSFSIFKFSLFYYSTFDNSWMFLYINILFIHCFQKSFTVILVCKSSSSKNPCGWKVVIGNRDSRHTFCFISEKINYFILDFSESVKMSILFWVQFLVFAFLALLQVEARPSASGDAVGDQDAYMIQEAIPFRHFYNLPSGVSFEN